MRTITIQAAALIDAPAERVYQILADYRNGHPQILPKDFFTALVVERGGYGEGTVFTLTTKLLGVSRSARMEVTEPQPGCLLKETDPESGLYSTFRVSPEHRGHHAHVTIVTEIPRSPGMKGAVEAWLLPRMLEKVYLAELQNLAQLARRGAREVVAETSI